MQNYETIKKLMPKIGSNTINDSLLNTGSGFGQTHGICHVDESETHPCLH